MKKVIGICGSLASGKDAAGGYISRKLNVPLFGCSSPVKEEIKKRGLEMTRTNMMLVGKELAYNKKGAFPVQLFLDQIKEVGVITGIRDPENIVYLKKIAQVILIGIEADSKIRFERAKKRNQVPEANTLGEFENHESREKSNSSMDVVECLKMADYTIENNSSLQEFEEKISKILKKEGLD